jgi:transcriptional regulator with XRE-family HTH domain
MAAAAQARKEGMSHAPHTVILADRLLEARQAAGLTQGELGHRIGVSKQAVSRWESGRCGMRSATVVIVAKALGIKAGELLG